MDIKLWKEWREDQAERKLACFVDPEYPSIKEYGIRMYSFYQLSVYQIEHKYGIQSETYENFLNWVADGKQKFTGVKVKHEVTTTN